MNLVFTYYNQPQMLAVQARHWLSYGERIWKRIRIVVIDDGSQECPSTAISELKDQGLDISLFRVKEDIRWNQAGAKNLAFQQVEGFTAVLDLDHVIEKTAMRRLIALRFDRAHWYLFPRAPKSSERKLNPAPNIYVVHSKDFWQAGGYDEDFAGHYGLEDGDFLRRLARVCEPVILNHVPLVVHESVDTDDACVSKTLGPLKQAGVTHNRKLMDAKAEADFTPTDHIRFEWEQVL